MSGSVATVSFGLPKPKRRTPPRKKFQVGLFHYPRIQAKYQEDLMARLELHDTSETSPNQEWDHLKCAILETSEEVLGYTKIGLTKMTL